MQFTLRALFVLTTAVACVFGIARWLDDYGGLVAAIPISVLPFVLVIERVFSPSYFSYAPITIRTYVWRHLTIVAAAFVVAFAALIGTSDGVPTLVSPLPFLIVLPLLMLSQSWLLVMAIPVATFLILNLYLGRVAMPHPIPLRFPVLLAIATVFSIYWFVIGVPYSHDYQGPTYAIGITVINASIIFALWFVWFFIRRSASYWPAFAWSLALICWLFWFAFPWLGELL